MFRMHRYLMLMVLLFTLSACITTPSGNDAGVDPVPQTDSPPSLKSSVSNTYSKLNFGLLAPLIGEWQVQDWQLQQDGQWQAQAGATWRFYPIQGGMSLEDEWRSHSSVDSQMGDPAEKQAPGYGTHLRVYEPLSRQWQSAWLSSRARTLEFYSGTETGSEVIFISLPNAKGRRTRTVFSNIGADFFNWRMEWSNDDGASWLTVYKVDATRTR